MPLRPTPVDPADLEQGVVLVGREGSPDFSDSSYTSASTDGGGVVGHPQYPVLMKSPIQQLCGGSGGHNESCCGGKAAHQHQHQQTKGTLADVRLRVLLCRKAWSLLFQSKMSVPLSSLTKFPRAAVVILLMILVSLAVFRPLSNYMRHSEIPELDSAMFSGRDSQDRIVLGYNHPVNHREKRPVKNGQWNSFGQSFPYEAYMYSAFYDDRMSIASLPVVRIISVMQESGEMEMFCALYYRATNRIQYVKVMKTDIGAGVQRHSKIFTEHILVCPIGHEEIPDKVGIVTLPGTQTETMIPVEIPERPPQQFNFGLCMSVSYWKQNPYHIVEWLEMLRILGVNGVTVYNNSLEYESAKVFLEYAKEGFVDFRQSHNFMNDDGELTIHMHMSPVINDCMYRSMYKYKRIIVTDWDELIIPHSVNNYHEMIEQIDKVQIPDNKSTGKHYLFRNSYFFVDIPGLDQSQPDLVTLRHRKRIPVSEPGYSVKSIIDPMSCTNMHNHYCWKRTDLYGSNDILIEVEPEYGVNQHYKRCHFDEFDNKKGECKRLFKEVLQDDIMLRYKNQLVQLVAAKLQKLGLKPL